MLWFMPLATAPQLNTAAVISVTGELHLEERPRPVPASDEVLVRIATVGICGSDTAYYRGTAAYTITSPFVMGHEASGIIEATGSDVGGLCAGTRVALVPNRACGACDQCRSGFDNLCSSTRYLGSAAVEPHQDGALQHYLTVPATHVLPLPGTVSLATGALLEPFAVALHAVRKTSVENKSVLIVGAGAIGQLTAVAARALGARRVTVADVSARRARTAVEHGADACGTPDELAAGVAAGDRYDVVFDASGHPSGVELALRAVRPGTGHVVLVGNLPAGAGIPVKYISQAESWVTSTLRFSGGLAPALEALTTYNLDISWLVEQNVDFEDIEEAFGATSTAEPPLKTHINFPPNHRSDPTSPTSKGPNDASI